jgi:hypothetical protein
MDTFNLMIAIILMMLAMQFQQNWLVFGTFALVVLTMRSFTALFVFLVATITLFLARNALSEYWPIIIFGILILALAVGWRSKPEEPEYGYGGLEDMLRGV